MIRVFYLGVYCYEAFLTVNFSVFPFFVHLCCYKAWYKSKFKSKVVFIVLILLLTTVVKIERTILVFSVFFNDRFDLKNYRFKNKPPFFNFQKNVKMSLIYLSFLTINYNLFLFQEDKIILYVFFIETNNLNVFWPRIVQPKNVFSLWNVFNDR